MRISDWSSDVCSSDLRARHHLGKGGVDMLAIGVAGKILQPAAGGIETEAGGDATADQAKAVPQAASAAMHLDQRQVAENPRHLQGIDIVAAGQGVDRKRTRLNSSH